MRLMLVFMLTLLVSACAGAGQLSKPSKPVMIGKQSVQLHTGDWVKTRHGFVLEVVEPEVMASVEETVFPPDLVEVRPAKR